MITSKTVTEAYGQKLVASEKEKIESYDSFDFDVESPTIINVNYRGIHVGKLIMKSINLSWSPANNGFDIRLDIRNINPE